MSKSYSGLFSETSGTLINSSNFIYSNDIKSYSDRNTDIRMHIFKETIIPPDVLYYGTSHKALDSIMNGGLKPTGRQYVYLSVDINTAVQFCKSRDYSLVILKIDAAKAHKDGIKFYKGSEKVILADYIPKQYIAL